MSNISVFSTAYMPPIAYFKAYMQTQNEGCIDAYEHYQKQSYRNRCYLHSPNGVLALTIPIQKQKNGHQVMKDIKISYEYDWQRLHWLTLESCYRSSAYFEYYEHVLEPFYTTKTTYLWEYNLSLFQAICKLLNIYSVVDITNKYEGTEAYKCDFRTLIHPKNNLNIKIENPYYQVFENKNGFVPNLSIIDLICSQGPRSNTYLKENVTLTII